MALKTKQALVDEIVYESYVGITSNSRSISDQFILRILNNKIAEAAMQSGLQNQKLDGVFYSDDIFRLTYTNLTLTADAVTFVKYLPLPTQPVGLPASISYEVFPPANRGGVQSSVFKMIDRGEATYVRSLPKIKKVFCYVDNGVLNFIDAFQIMATYDTVNLSVVSSGANDLTAFVNMPDDMIGAVKTACVAEVRAMMQLTDLTPQPPADNPQPR